MSTDVWFNNPWNYIREVAEVGHHKVTWNWGILNRKKINPVAVAELHFTGRPWEALCIGGLGATLYRAGDKFGKPTAVYPVWDANRSTEELVAYLNYDVGQDKELCEDESVPRNLRPVYGQDRVVVVTNIPPLRETAGKQLMRYINSLQEEFPEVTIFVSGMVSYKWMFGGNLKAVDFNPRSISQSGELCLPSGLRARPEWCVSHAPHYIEMFDFAPKELREPRKCCLYNLKSAIWSSVHYQDEVAYMVRKGLRSKYDERVRKDPEFHMDDTPAPESSVIFLTPPTRLFKPVVGKLARPPRGKPGDKFMCNLCTLQLSCKLFRVGAVCAVPGSEPVPLSKFFGTRDSDKIVDGLSILVQGQMNRLEDAMKEETTANKGLNPEVSKEITRAFTNGVKLAQLIDPSLRPSAKVAINVNGANAAAVGGADPAQLVSQIVRELELQGVKREDITDEMIANALSAIASGRKPVAIEGRVER